jgi:hypothetical protein
MRKVGDLPAPGDLAAELDACKLALAAAIVVPSSEGDGSGESEACLHTSFWRVPCDSTMVEFALSVSMFVC